MNYTKTVRELEKDHDKKKTVKVQDVFPSSKENKKIYEVFIKNYSPMNFALTILNPGTVKKEFYMTKGHVHKTKMQEFYILLEGKGKLILQKGPLKEINLKKKELNLVPSGFAHRLINTGKTKLKVLTIYHEDSEPQYGVKFKKRFFKK
ncbi:MAG: glucose-6-phosphate isomerase family protein [Nanoarchaeota archaeon]